MVVFLWVPLVAVAFVLALTRVRRVRPA
jgi:hypothetical protein